ncbi:hypothetical protein E4U16_004675 [Claviceps sp. LM84 group G4]|nr:hypothetical protein E4U16_004675 [Claviceps sp. LM84 group G4]
MNRCLLRDREDWRTWINTFSARATNSNTWKKLDPDHPVPLRVKPTRPQLPEPSKYHGAFSNQSRPSELSDQGYKAYKRDLLDYDMLLMHYNSDLEAYEREQKKIRELTALLQSTVSLYLQRKCCLPDRPLQEWLSSLKAEVGVDDCENQPPQASQQRYETQTTGIHGYLKTTEPLQMQQHILSPRLSNRCGHADFFPAVAKGSTMSIFVRREIGSLETLRCKEEIKERFREHTRISQPQGPGNERAGAFAAVDDTSTLAEAGAATQSSKRDAPVTAESAPSTKRIRNKCHGNQASSHRVRLKQRRSMFSTPSNRELAPAW